MKILVLVIDSLPLSYLGCYGNDWIDTPALDRLAAEGVVFDRHYADCPQPCAARRAWRTGCYQFPLADDGTPLNLSSADLVHALHEAGVATTLIVQAHPSAPSEFQSGWGSVIEMHRASEDDEALPRTIHATLERLTTTEHWLLWIELAELLPPWNPHEELFARYFQLDEELQTDAPVAPLADPDAGLLPPDDDVAFLRLQSSYGALVAELDARIAELLDALAQCKLLDEILLIVTSDTGLALGEHGIVGNDRPWLHEELVHLPLLMRLPHGAEGGRRVHALTQPVDLMPTLLAAFGLTVSTQGHNLWPLLRGEVESVRAFACSGLRQGAALEWAVRTPEWSFILPLSGEPGDAPRAAQLYVLPADRGEMNNVIQHHWELAEQLEKTLRESMLAACGVASRSANLMATVKLVDENDTNPIVQEVFRDIKETKKIDRVPNIWRALATNPEHLRLCWTRLKAIMQPGKLDLLTKEIIALAVSATNNCDYCINSHTAAVQRLGLDYEGLGEVLAVVGLFNQMNSLANAYQVEPDILPVIPQ